MALYVKIFAPTTHTNKIYCSIVEFSFSKRFEHQLVVITISVGTTRGKLKENHLTHTQRVQFSVYF